MGQGTVKSDEPITVSDQANPGATANHHQDLLGLRGGGVVLGGGGVDVDRANYRRR